MWKIEGTPFNSLIGLKTRWERWLMCSPEPFSKLWLCFHDSWCTLFWTEDIRNLLEGKLVLMDGKGMCRVLCCPLALLLPSSWASSEKSVLIISVQLASHCDQHSEYRVHLRDWGAGITYLLHHGESFVCYSFVTEDVNTKKITV